VSGITTTSGGAGNIMGGGRGKLTCTSTLAIVEVGTVITNAKKIVPKSNFFILSSPILIRKLLLTSAKRFFRL
jgi:hypothetical protein